MGEDGSSAIRLRVLRGVVWSCASLAGGRMLVLASTSVLARLLSPRDFGLVALALIFTTALDAIRDLGINQALIVTEDDGGDHADTAFCATVAMATALALTLAALSPTLAGFFAQPQLVALLVVLAVNLPLRSLGLTHYSLAQRALDFRLRTAADLTEIGIRGTVSIGLALGGFGPWSLVIGYLCGTFAWSIVLWTRLHWRPALRVRRSALSPLIRFGGGLGRGLREYNKRTPAGHTDADDGSPLATMSLQLARAPADAMSTQDHVARSEVAWVSADAER